jgi:hypothetical protein
MAFYYLQNVRPLHSLTDAELLQIVDLYSEGVFQVNDRIITSIETKYDENPDESILHFRITTESLYPEKNGPDNKTSGFTILLDVDQQDLYFMPLNKQVYFEAWLNSNGITEEFSSHRLSINTVFEFFKDKLKLWNRTADHPVHNYAVREPYEWRRIQVADADKDIVETRITGEK